MGFADEDGDLKSAIPDYCSNLLAQLSREVVRMPIWESEKAHDARWLIAKGLARWVPLVEGSQFGYLELV